jgi:hypothetical protein
MENSNLLVALGVEVSNRFGSATIASGCGKRENQRIDGEANWVDL